MTRQTLKRDVSLVVISFVALGISAMTQPINAQDSGSLSPGEVRTVLGLPVGNSPEGIALDGRTIYVSNRRFVPVPEDGAVIVSSEILKITPNGKRTVFATFADTGEPGANGALGLAIGSDGSIYAAFDSRDPNTRGVWRIKPNGSMERLAGSERMEFPNGLTFDQTGYLYATDSQLGGVWRWGPDRTGGPWVHHFLLAPLPFDPLGFPLPGANGIAFYPPNHLYIANTEHGLLLHTAISADGLPGPVEIIAGNPVPEDPTTWVPDFRLWTVDGIATDENGSIHAVIPGFAVLSARTGLELSPLVRVDPDSTVILTPTKNSAFDVPLSLAFGRTSPDETSVFVTNGALPLGLPGRGPGVVQAEVGVRGFLGR